MDSSPTMHDVAKAAGVNPSTVSRVFSKNGRVSERTRKHVENVASEVGYRGDSLRPDVPSSCTRILGIIVADFADPSCWDIIRGVETAASGLGFKLMLSGSLELPGSGTHATRTAAPDGLIMVNSTADEDLIRELARHKPVVLINRQIEGITSVVPDIQKGVGQAVRSLRAQGHRKLAFIAGPKTDWISIRAWEEVRTACEWPRLDPIRLAPAEPTVEGGRKTASEVRASGATAVLAYNDLIAIGLLGELRAASITAPDNISIIGFGDICGATFTTPSLTTIRVLGGKSGANAVALIAQILKGKAVSSPTTVVQTELVVRASTGRCPSSAS